MRAFPSCLCAAVFLGLAACASAPDEVPGAGGLAGRPDLGDAGAPLPAGMGEGGLERTDLPPGVEPGSQEDLEVTVGDRIFFDYDSSVLTSLATQTLDRQAAWLNQYPGVTVTIEGHADERGTREYNLALGDRRANTVRNYLIALGVEPSRLLTISYGEERPAVPGSTEEAYAKNRRAVTVVNTVG